MKEEQREAFKRSKALVTRTCELNGIARAVVQTTPIAYGLYGLYLRAEKLILVHVTPRTPSVCTECREDVSLESTVAHELGHHLDEELFLRRSFPCGERVFNYEPNAGEALAESIRLFIIAPERFQWLNKRIRV